MNKWYRSGLTKGILVVLQHVFVVTAAISLIWTAAYPGLAEDMVSGKQTKEYQDSEGFARQVYYDSEQILWTMSMRQNFETDNQYDPDRIVDIKQYTKETTVSNQNINGLSYTLGDLNQWAKALNRGEVKVSTYGESPEEKIIVCQKPDGTYDYYLFSALQKLFQEGTLYVANLEDGEAASAEDDLQNALQSGNVTEGSLQEYTDAEGILDQDGNVKYVDCWNYDGWWIEEKYAPVDASSILEIVQNDPNWNGKLSEAYQDVENVVRAIGDQLDEYRLNMEEWQEGDTNLTYIYANTAEQKVYTNNSKYGDYSKLDANVEELTGSGRYVIVKPKLSEFKTNLKAAEASVWKADVKSMGISESDFVYAVKVDTGYPIQDTYFSQNILYEKYAPRIQMIAITCIASVILFLTGLIWLTVTAGRRAKDEGLHLNTFDKWKTELAAGILLVLWVIPMLGFGEYMNSSLFGLHVDPNYSVPYTYYGTKDMFSVPNLIMVSLVAVYTCAMFLTAYLSLVRRLKAKTFWRNSLLRSFCKLLKEVFESVHSAWKTALIFGGFILVHWLAIAFSYTGFWVFAALVVDMVSGIYLLRHAVGRQKIRIGIERIASGEVDHKIPLKGLKGEQLVIAKRVNSIGEGLDAAVEASMKNERLKTDLITNVSHDIKTPLTSIINYVDLLKRENFTDPKILGYLDVLEAKAQRLKTLTEDVVEASKVSSGNITLEYMNINLAEMIQQTSGEFQEKFEKRHLQEILSLPQEEAVIRVDGRRMWRVLENIYNNAAKYAMEGTRVYADLRTTDCEVIFSLKNVSEQPLNITADELTERFIRGDVSRSTEGSGLGLSIAKSLAEMQGGRFDLYLDGDLFRVTITFPRMVKPIEREKEETVE